MANLKDKIQKAELIFLSCFGQEQDAFAYNLDFLALILDEEFFCIAKSNMDEQLTQSLENALANENIIKVFFNLKTDIHFLESAGLNILKAQQINNFQDLMTLSYVLNSSNFGSKSSLQKVAKYFLQSTIAPQEDILGKGVKKLNYAQLEKTKLEEYLIQYMNALKQCYEYFEQNKSELSNEFKINSEIELPLILVLAKIEQCGMFLNTQLLNQQSDELEESLNTIKDQAYSLAGEEFNMNSPKQIQYILFDKLQMSPLKKTSTGQQSTGEGVLKKLAEDYDLPLLILNYRSLTKLKSGYTDALPKHTDSGSRVHTQLNQTITSTGRLSSSNPNLQNIPVKTQEGRKIRKSFIAPEDCQLISADYSQIELRIMAQISQDEKLLEAFAKNEDIHKATAKEVFELDEVNSEQRRFAKSINFGLIYGMSAFGLSNQLQISVEEANVYINAYFNKYQKVKSYMESTRIEAKKNGFVQTVLGRKVYLPLIKSPNKFLQKEAERAAINAPLQGTAADIIKMAMIKVDRELDQSKAKLIMQIHDELLFEVPNKWLDEMQTQIKSIMESVMELDSKLVVDVGIGMNWEEAH